MEEQINQTIDQLVFFLIFPNYMKDAYIVNYTITLIRIFFQNTSVDFVKASVLSTLLVMIEKMKTARDNKQFCAAILTDLSKAFDCICHDLLISKLNAYGVDRNALKLFYDSLSDRSQKTKVGSSFSAYLDIIYGVPQGSILGLLLFNIDLCDLFFEDYSSDFANFADDTTPYECLLNEIHLMKS